MPTTIKRCITDPRSINRTAVVTKLTHHLQIAQAYVGSGVIPVLAGIKTASQCSPTELLGPFHGAIAVPSVTRCRCRCRCRRRRRRGHRCAGGVRRDSSDTW